MKETLKQHSKGGRSSILSFWRRIFAEKRDAEKNGEGKVGGTLRGVHDSRIETFWWGGFFFNPLIWT